MDYSCISCELKVKCPVLNRDQCPARRIWSTAQRLSEIAEAVSMIRVKDISKN